MHALASQASPRPGVGNGLVSSSALRRARCVLGVSATVMPEEMSSNGGHVGRAGDGGVRSMPVVVVIGAPPCQGHPPRGSRRAWGPFRNDVILAGLEVGIGQHGGGVSEGRQQAGTTGSSIIPRGASDENCDLSPRNAWQLAAQASAAVRASAWRAASMRTAREEATRGGIAAACSTAPARCAWSIVLFTRG